MSLELLSSNQICVEIARLRADFEKDARSLSEDYAKNAAIHSGAVQALELLMRRLDAVANPAPAPEAPKPLAVVPEVVG